MRNPTITREALCAAVGAGIAAYPALTEPEKDALRQVAATTKVVGGDYYNGCPWSQAFGVEGGIIGNHVHRQPNKFAFSYDDAITALAFSIAGAVIVEVVG